MSDFSDIARQLWLDARPEVVAQSGGALAAARTWADSGDPDSWATLVRVAHKLAGSLGTYAAALRLRSSQSPTFDEASHIERAARAAVALNEAVQSARPESTAILAAAESLAAAVENT